MISCKCQFVSYQSRMLSLLRPYIYDVLTLQRGVVVIADRHMSRVSCLQKWSKVSVIMTNQFPPPPRWFATIESTAIATATSLAIISR